MRVRLDLTPVVALVRGSPSLTLSPGEVDVAFTVPLETFLMGGRHWTSTVVVEELDAVLLLHFFQYSPSAGDIVKWTDGRARDSPGPGGADNRTSINSEDAVEAGRLGMSEVEREPFVVFGFTANVCIAVAMKLLQREPEFELSPTMIMRGEGSPTTSRSKL